MDFRKSLARAARRVWPPHPAIDSQAAHYRETAWYPPARLAEYQQRLLRDLLAHCWHAVPYYRRLMEEAGATGPNGLSLDLLPTLTKEDLREHADALRSTDLDRRKWYVNYSGGSTGEPVQVVQDRDYAVRSEGRKVVCFELAGYKQGASMVRLWGSQRDILSGGIGLRAAAGGFLRNTRTMNAFRMTPELMRTYLKALDRRPPQALYGYAQAVFEVARYAQEHDMHVAPPGAVISTSGTLYPHLRQTIEDVFGCEVFDQYGSREVSCIAQECDHHEGLHLNMETVLVEVLDPDGAPCPPGVEGDIAVTSLANYAMPLVRYRIGDRGIMAEHPCSCGRGLALLEQVTGRGVDSLRRADGTVIPGEYFIHFVGVVYNRQWVGKFQVVQTEYERVVLKVVPKGEGPTPEEREELRHVVGMVMGEDCRVDIDLVDDIPPSDSGKYLYTVSMLDA